MARIVIFKGASRYNVLRFFVDELETAFRQLGKDVVVVDRADQRKVPSAMAAAFSEPCELVLAFNAIGKDIDLDGRSLYDMAECPYVAFLVDHPLYHIARLDRHVENLIVTCVDRDHVEFVNSFYEGRKTCFFLPQAGSSPKGDELPPFDKRDITVFFPGSLMNVEEMRRKWKENFDCFAGIMDDIVEVALSHNCSLAQCVDIVFRSRGVSLDKTLLDAFWRQLPYVNHYIRSYRRSECVKILSDAGFELLVLGSSWNSTPFASKLRIGDPVDFKEMVLLMRRSKIVLNVNPNLQDGCCERIFYAMLNGAVAVTDKTRYLAEEFRDLEDLLFFTWGDISSLPDKINDILQSPDKWAAVASAGQKKASERHTWLVRAQQILEMAKQFMVLKIIKKNSISPRGPV